MIAWSERLDGSRGSAALAFTDRRGGVSEGVYGDAGGAGGLNLGSHVGDDATHVERNRALVAEAVGLTADRLVVADQVHGADVVQVDAPFGAAPPSADALVTTTAGLVLAVLVADCVPVLLAAPDDGVLAVAHAGRPGMAAGVVPAAVAAMRDLGARRVEARLGPSVCGRCYEVPAELRDEVARRAPLSASVTWSGTPAIDVAAGVLAQLAELGVPARQLPGCTRESPSLYSYRREGRTGRFAGLAWLPGAA